MILQLFVPVFAGLVLTLLLTPLSIRLSRRFGLLDDPSSAPHKIHTGSVPKAGGIAIVIGVSLITVLSGGALVPDIRAILLAGAVIFIFGIWDDARGLNAPWKLTGQLLATALLMWQGVYVRMFAYPALNLLITLVWVVGITNAFNLVDSMDGLAVGLAAIAAAFFMLVTLDAGQPDLATLSAILLGSCFGMFAYNAPPARTFLGDSGAQTLGFMLAALAIVYTPPGLPQPSSWFVPILLLGIPIYDTTLVVISRLRRRAPIYHAARDHTYHRLVLSGMSPAQAVTVMHVAALSIGCLAFIALPLPPLWANALFALTLVCALVSLSWLERSHPA
jgi:UDP-GlcNAc:undecaprenyl-phosphate GlcNAc-1-phosphate transferase